MSVNNAYKLIDDINKKIYNWNERSQFKLKGVGNLSRADLDILVMYAEAYINSDGYDFGTFRSPLGNMKDVLDKYGIIVEDNGFGW